MNLKIKVILVLLIAAGVFYFFTKNKHTRSKNEIIKEIHVTLGDIRKENSVTAIVQPQNRLEMKPPVAGRVEEILVKEGTQVKAGQTVALMSSTERAALLDAAKSKGPEEMAYWQDIYKPIALIAPIDGTVIVSTMQPGQALTQADAVVVLSDRLIVQAQVDETDIGRVQEGQSARITLDAYPEVEVSATINHIYHESTVVNNVTIYRVDILPENVPPVFRSGMSATAFIVEAEKKNVWLLPLEAIKRDKQNTYVDVKKGSDPKPEKRSITLGVSDEKNVEIVSGIDPEDTVLLIGQKYAGSKNLKTGSNPFFPGASASRPKKEARPS